MEDDVTAGTGGATGRGRLSPDLRARIIAGLGLAVVAGGLAWAGLLPFAAFILVIALLMSWEWGRVVRDGAINATLFVHAASTALAIGLSAFGLAALGLAAVLAGAIIVFALEIGSRSLLSAAGALYTGIPAVALLWLRSSEPWGFVAVLFIFAVVVATDTMAYFCGRLIGGPKLWPKVSPNKTWAGFAGGIASGALMGASFNWSTGSSALGLAALGLLLGLVSQGGDLAESALKRSFGVKDASALIPGHGGFMDRADGIVAAAIVAAVLALYFDPRSPASALLLRSAF